MVMEDGVESNEMDVELVSLTEMIAEHLADKPPAWPRVRFTAIAVADFRGSNRAVIS